MSNIFSRGGEKFSRGLRPPGYGPAPKAVFSASERKYTAAGGDVPVPWGGIHE